MNCRTQDQLQIQLQNVQTEHLWQGTHVIMHQLHVKWVRGEPMKIKKFVIDTINDSNDDDDNEYQLYSQRYLQYTISNS